MSDKLELASVRQFKAHPMIGKWLLKQTAVDIFSKDAMVLLAAIVKPRKLACTFVQYLAGLIRYFCFSLTIAIVHQMRAPTSEFDSSLKPAVNFPDSVVRPKK